VIAIGSPAYAGGSSSKSAFNTGRVAPVDPDASESEFLEENFIVLPEELRAYGVSEKQIARQQAKLDSLAPEVRARQDALRTEQDALTAQYLSGSGFVDSQGHTLAGTVPATAEPITPYAYGDTCTTTTNVYRVRWVVPSNGNWAYICVYPPAGTVSYSGGIDNVVAINSGTTNGRIYYYRSNNGYYYWSVWRNDGVWHDFYDVLYYGGTIEMFKVQIG